MDIEGNLALTGCTSSGPIGENRVAPTPLLRDLVRAALKQCQQRRRMLPELTLEDPRWLMALDLLLGVEERRPVTITNLAIAAEVPFSTALRHINAMVSEGLLRRVAHPTDGRVVYIELSPQLQESLADYLLTIYGLAERIRATALVGGAHAKAPPADNDVRPEPAAAMANAPDLPGWQCVARTNGRFVSTILTRNDVSIALVFPDVERSAPEELVMDRIGELPQMATD